MKWLTIEKAVRKAPADGCPADGEKYVFSAVRKTTRSITRMLQCFGSMFPSVERFFREESQATAQSTREP